MGQHERRWNERAIVMDDASYAFAAQGDYAIETLCELFDEDDPWVIINAVFALGEIGPAAAKAVPRLAELLKNPNQTVVRQTLDAIASIGMNMNPAIENIESQLTHSNADWQNSHIATRIGRNRKSCAVGQERIRFD